MIDLLEAMRADAIPNGTSGPWAVWTWDSDGAGSGLDENYPLVPAGRYKVLRCATASTIHIGGESVMSDDPPELRRHLEFVLRARGRVLITGLGLGCVLRGVLTRPEVTRVDVVERERDVLKLVLPHLPDDPRLHVHHSEAIDWLENVVPDERWDTVWHDVWGDTDAGELHTQVTHGRLLLALRGRVDDWQGAWNFPRHLKRTYRAGFPDAKAWAR